MKSEKILWDSRIVPMMVTVIVCLVAMGPVAVMAQDDGSFYNNPAQAQKASNLAAAAALDSDDQELAGFVDAADTAEKELAEAEEALGNLPDNATEEQQQAAQAAVDTARANLESADQAVADKLSELAGVYSDQIQDYREEGMGWGVIAQELGVHPGVLGNRYGQQRQNQAQTQNQNRNRNRNKEMAAYGYGKKAGVMSSTMRNLRTGGNAYGKSKNNQGLGKGINNAGGLGKANGKGNAGGKGNNGNHGNGNNGNGKGNDKN